MSCAVSLQVTEAKEASKVGEEKRKERSCVLREKEVEDKRKHDEEILATTKL
jgi:hypothetical protein